MTLTEFDNGYWYATELKEFAEAIGIPSAAKLRKDELEKAIKLVSFVGDISSRCPTRLSGRRCTSLALEITPLNGEDESFVHSPQERTDSVLRKGI